MTLEGRYPPPVQTWEGRYPPTPEGRYPLPTNGEQSENITSSRTTYAVGKDQKRCTLNVSKIMICICKKKGNEWKLKFD